MDGSYKSEFIMRMNRVVFQGEYRCPREVPIKIVLKVDGNAITGSINNMHEKCSDWQNATIKGLIDEQGNFIKTKFLHAVLPWGRLEDAYKIEGNILGEMTLKSKSTKRCVNNYVALQKRANVTFLFTTFFASLL